jgi:AMMECR1 domain-containing protein
VVGVHGLMITAPRGPRRVRGLLLPKVAADQGWDVETFLSRTCEKADLAPDFWRGLLAGGDGGTIERFTAQVFDEKTLQTGPFAPS